MTMINRKTLKSIFLTYSKKLNKIHNTLKFLKKKGKKRKTVPHKTNNQRFLLIQMIE